MVVVVVEMVAMLGPALQLLYKSLGERSSELTPYESQLFQELANAARLGQPLHKANPVKLRRPHMNPAPALAGKVGRFGVPADDHQSEDQIFSERMDTHIDLGPGGKLPQLQINCPEDKCPNKKRK